MKCLHKIANENIYFKFKFDFHLDHDICIVRSSR